MNEHLVSFQGHPVPTWEPSEMNNSEKRNFLVIFLCKVNIINLEIILKSVQSANSLWTRSCALWLLPYQALITAKIGKSRFLCSKGIEISFCDYLGTIIMQYFMLNVKLFIFLVIAWRNRIMVKLRKYICNKCSCPAPFVQKFPILCKQSDFSFLFSKQRLLISYFDWCTSLQIFAS